jgi:hypothetical protein
MANRLIRRLAWAAAGAAVALTPRLLQLARSKPARRSRAISVATTAEAADRPIQQLTRYRDAAGNHTIHGTLLAEFQPGERTASLMIAFCPPFEQLPTIEAEAIDDAGASVKVTQLLHNGAQFEIRLSQPSDEHHQVTIEILATDPPLAA